MTTYICILAVILFGAVSSVIAADSHEIGKFRQMALDTHLPTSARLRYIDSLLSLASNDKDLVDILLIKGDLCFSDLRRADAIAQYHNLLLKHSGELSLDQKCHINNNLMMLYLRLSEYSAVIECGQKIINTPKPDSLSYYDGLAYLNLTELFIKLNRYEDAETYVEAALRNAETASDNIPILQKKVITGGAHSYKSVIESKKKNYHHALEELSEANKYIINENSELCLIVNRGLIYSFLGENDVALDCYRDLVERNIYNFNTGVALNNAINLLVKYGQFNEAIDFYMSHVRIAEVLNGDIMASYLHQNLSDAYLGVGKIKDAYRHLLQSKTLSDSINSTDRNVKLYSQINLFYDHQRDRLINKRHERIQTLILIIVILLILLVGVGIIIVFVSRRKIRCKRENGFIKEKIILLESNINKDFKAVDSTLNLQQNELTSLSMRLAQTNEALRKISDLTNDSNLDLTERVQNVRSELKSAMLDKNFWETFNLYFGSLNSKFINHLYELHPNLGKGEYKLCAFLLMNLSNKDIASITGRAVRSVESEKYRLRKKLKINEPTEAYLRRIAREAEE